MCFDKKMFSTFEQIEIGEKVFMGKSASSEIKGQEKVVFKMMYVKDLTLTNVFMYQKYTRTWSLVLC